MATCTVEECQDEYKPKSGSKVHAAPLIGHLKRKNSNLYSEAVEKTRKKTQGVKYNFGSFVESPHYVRFEKKHPRHVLNLTLT